MSSGSRRAVLPAHGSFFQIAGASWILGSACFVTSQVLEAKVPSLSVAGSLLQVIGVGALIVSILGILGGLARLGALLASSGQRAAAGTVWAVFAGMVLLPLLGLGAALLIPGLLAMVVVGRLGYVNVRLPVLLILVGMLAAARVAGWSGGVEGPPT